MVSHVSSDSLDYAVHGGNESMAKWISVCTHLIRVQLAERNVSRISIICYANTHMRNNAYGNIEHFVT